MKNAVKFIIALIIGFSLFYFFVKEAGFEVVLSSAALFFNWKGFLIILLSFLIALLGAIRWKMILSTTGENISLLLALRYHIKGFTVDYLTPFAFFGGETVRIFLLEKKVGIKKSAFASITDKIMGITTHFLFFLAGMILFLFYGLSQYNLLFFYLILAVIIVSSLVLFFFYFQALRKKSFLSLFFNSFKKVFKENRAIKSIVLVESKILDFFSKPRVFFKIALVSFTLNIVYFLRILLIIYFITGLTNIVFALIIYGLVMFSMFLPLPASIGGMEVVLGFGFGVLGIGISYGIMMAIILRSAELFICFIGILLLIRMSFFSFLSEFKMFLTRDS